MNYFLFIFMLLLLIPHLLLHGSLCLCGVLEVAWKWLFPSSWQFRRPCSQTGSSASQMGRHRVQMQLPSKGPGSPWIGHFNSWTAVCDYRKSLRWGCPLAPLWKRSPPFCFQMCLSCPSAHIPAPLYLYLSCFPLLNRGCFLLQDSIVNSSLCSVCCPQTSLSVRYLVNRFENVYTISFLFLLWDS